MVVSIDNIKSLFTYAKLVYDLYKKSVQNKARCAAFAARVGVLLPFIERAAKLKGASMEGYSLIVSAIEKSYALIVEYCGGEDAAKKILSTRRELNADEANEDDMAAHADDDTFSFTRWLGKAVTVVKQTATATSFAETLAAIEVDLSNVLQMYQYTTVISQSEQQDTAFNAAAATLEEIRSSIERVEEKMRDIQTREGGGDETNTAAYTALSEKYFVLLKELEDGNGVIQQEQTRLQNRIEVLSSAVESANEEQKEALEEAKRSLSTQLEASTERLSQLLAAANDEQAAERRKEMNRLESELAKRFDAMAETLATVHNTVQDVRSDVSDVKLSVDNIQGMVKMTAKEVMDGMQEVQGGVLSLAHQQEQHHKEMLSHQARLFTTQAEANQEFLKLSGALQTQLAQQTTNGCAMNDQIMETLKHLVLAQEQMRNDLKNQKKKQKAKSLATSRSANVNNQKARGGKGLSAKDSDVDSDADTDGDDNDDESPNASLTSPNRNVNLNENFQTIVEQLDVMKNTRRTKFWHSAVFAALEGVRGGSGSGTQKAIASKPSTGSPLSQKEAAKPLAVITCEDPKTEKTSATSTNVAVAEDNANPLHSQFLRAAYDGDAKAVDALLKQMEAEDGTFSTSIVNTIFDSVNRGWTALHFAAQQGHLEVCRLLINTYHADVNASADCPAAVKQKTRDGTADADDDAVVEAPLAFLTTPCFIAARSKRKAIVKLFMTQSNVLQFPCSAAPLSLAACCGDVKAMRALLEGEEEPSLSALVNAKEPSSCPHKLFRGATALHFAAFYGQLEAVRMLMEEYGADDVMMPSSPSSSPSEGSVSSQVDGWCALHFACLGGGARRRRLQSSAPSPSQRNASVGGSGHLAVIEYLCAALPAAKSSQSPPAAAPLSPKESSFSPPPPPLVPMRNRPDKSGRTPLFIAVAFGWFEAVEVFKLKARETFSYRSLLGSGKAPAGEADGENTGNASGKSREENQAKKRGDAIADKMGNTLLHIAAAHGVGVVREEGIFPLSASLKQSSRDYDDLINYLLQQPTCGFHNNGSITAIDIQNDNTETPLHHAAAGGFLSTVKLLLEEHEASVDARNHLNKSPLYVAAGNGRTDVVQYLLDYSVAANASAAEAADDDADDCDVAKKTSAEQGSKSIPPLSTPSSYLSQLVETRYYNECTLMHAAAANGRLATVRYLVESCKANANSKNIDSNSPLYLAAYYNHADVVEYFITPSSSRQKGAVVGCGVSVDGTNFKRQTALHAAAQNGSLETVQLLMGGRRGGAGADDAPKTPIANPYLLNVHGCTPLALAVSGGRTDIVRFLITECNIDVDVPLCGGGKAKQSLAAGSNSAGASLSPFGLNALSIAASTGFLDTVRVLVKELGANIYHRNVNTIASLSNASSSFSFPTTALYLAAANGHTEVVSFFLGECAMKVGDRYGGGDDAKPAPQSPDRKGGEGSEGGGGGSEGGGGGETILHVACRNGHLGVVKMLIEEFRADPNVLSVFNSPQKSIAVGEGNANAGAEATLGKGAHKRQRVMAPLALAAEHGRMDVIQYLCVDLNQQIESGAAGAAPDDDRDGDDDDVPLTPITPVNVHFVGNDLGEDSLPPSVEVGGEGGYQSAFFIAVFRKQFDAALQLAKECKGSSASPPLLLLLRHASSVGDIDMLRFLVEEMGVSADARVPLSYIPAQDATSTASESAADTQQPTEHATPLCIAAGRGHLEYCKYLVEKLCANLFVPSGDGIAGGEEAFASGYAQKANFDEAYEYLSTQMNAYETLVKRLFPNKSVAFNVSSSASIPTPKEVADRQKVHDEEQRQLALKAAEAKRIAAAQKETFESNPYDAAANGSLPRVKYFLEKQRMSVNAQLREYSILYHAAEKNQVDVVRYLVTQAGAYVDAENNSKWTALHIAARNGHLETVKCLVLEGNANPNLKCKNQAGPLYYAAERGHTKIVRFLISGDAEKSDVSGNTNTQRKQRLVSVESRHWSTDWTALHISAFEGRLETVTMLVNELNANIYAATSYRRLPIYVATNKGHTEVVRFLLNAAASSRHTSATPMIECVDNYGFTPLLTACYYGFVEIVRLLTTGGYKANLNARTSDTNRSPIYLAARYGFTEILEHLVLNCGANVEDKSYTDEQWTPLQIAAWAGNFATCQILLEKLNADLFAKNKFGRTSLYHAAETGRNEIVAYFLTNEAYKGVIDVNSKDIYGCTPLQIAAQNGHTETVKAIVAATLSSDSLPPKVIPLDVTLCDSNGRNAIDKASPALADYLRNLARTQKK